MLKGLFISPHQGMIAELRQTLSAVKDTEWTFRTSFLEDFTMMGDLQAAVLRIVGEKEYEISLGNDFYNSKLFCYDKDYCSDMYDAIKPFWDAKVKDYNFCYDALLYDINQYNIVILALSPFMHYFIRRASPTIPVIYYPRMLVESTFTIPIIKDADFTYITHDKTLDKYKIFRDNVEQKLIISSLNPDCYGPYSGHLTFIVTLFNYMFKIGQPQLSDKYCGQHTVYEQIVSGIPHSLFGINHTIQHGSHNVDGALVPDVIRRYRCALAFSRSYSAISTAQMLASGIPTIGYVYPGNEMYDMLEHGVSGFMSLDVAEIRCILLELLKDHDYARKIGSAGKEAYYATHPWNTYISQWTELIHGKAK